METNTQGNIIWFWIGCLVTGIVAYNPPPIRWVKAEAGKAQITWDCTIGQKIDLNGDGTGRCDFVNKGTAKGAAQQDNVDTVTPRLST